METLGSRAKLATYMAVAASALGGAACQDSAPKQVRVPPEADGVTQTEGIPNQVVVTFSPGESEAAAQVNCGGAVETSTVGSDGTIEITCESVLYTLRVSLTP